MDWFIQSENIHRYQKLLEQVSDENQRQLLLKLLSEEKAKRPIILEKTSSARPSILAR